MPTDSELELEEAQARIACYRQVSDAAIAVRILCDTLNRMLRIGEKVIEKQMDKAVAEAVRDIPTKR